MSTATAPAENAEKPFLTPEDVAVGDSVIWSATPEAPGSNAFITAVGRRTVDLIYFDATSSAGTLLTGVVWAKAPSSAVEQSLRGDNGVWNYSPLVLRVKKLEEQMASLLSDKKSNKQS